MINITVNSAGFKRKMGRFRKQVPFATSVALNRTANEFQEEQRKRLSRRFTLRRRQFLLRGVAKIERSDRANKRRLWTRIKVDPRVSFLVKFEKGKRKLPRGTNLAIPTASLKRTKAGVVPKSLRPSALSFQESGGKIKGEKRTFIIKGVGVFQRVGRGGRASVRMLYAFKKSAPTPRILEFISTARRTVRRRYDIQFRRAWAEAIRSARR